MNTARIEIATGRLDYQTPRFVSYGLVAAITGQPACSHFQKNGFEFDHLNNVANDLSPNEHCTPGPV